MASGFLSRWSKQESIPLLGELKCFNFDVSCSLIMGFNVEVRHHRHCRLSGKADPKLQRGPNLPAFHLDSGSINHDG